MTLISVASNRVFVSTLLSKLWGGHRRGLCQLHIKFECMKLCPASDNYSVKNSLSHENSPEEEETFKEMK